MSLEDYIEKRALIISIRLGSKQKVCPRCRSQLSLTSDIVFSEELRIVVYCSACGWWLALLERMPSDYRNEPPTSSNDWPPPLTTPPSVA